MYKQISKVSKLVYVKGFIFIKFVVVLFIYSMCQTWVSKTVSPNL